MAVDLIIDKTEGASDIIPLFVGNEACSPGHSFGPYIRSYYLIHYCISGKGVLCDKYGEHNVGKGELFIIRPGEITTYTADGNDPWNYVWLAFKGVRAEVFTTERSVYTCSSEPFSKLLRLFEAEETSPDVYTSVLYDIIYRLFAPKNESADTLGKIKKYVRYNYMMNISAESISKAFGYERTYLYRIFKKRYGVSIKEYIIKVRMENAKSFLEDGCSVCDTARMCGYNDEFNFSRAYKKHYGYSPSNARKFADT